MQVSWQAHLNHLDIVLSCSGASVNEAPKTLSTERIGDSDVIMPNNSGEPFYRLAANEHGIVFCLLTNDEAISKTETLKDSDQKEDFFTHVLAANSHKDVRVRLSEVDFQGLNPLQLIVFPGIYTPLQWEWDGRKLREVVAPPPLIAASSTDSKNRENKLEKEFRKETSGFINSISFDKQIALHENYRFNEAGNLPFSLVKVQVRPEKIYISYRTIDPKSPDDTESECQLSRSSVNPNGQSIKEPDEYEDDLIDIRRLFREKSPELDQKIPSWVMGVIKGVIKEKTLNYYLNNLRPVPCNFFSSTVMNHFGIRGKLKPPTGKLPAPENRLIFMANHPTGGFDGLLLLAWVSHYYPDVRIVVNDLLWNIPHLRPYLVPVDILGETRGSRDFYYESFRDQSPLLIYPAGVTARKYKGKLIESHWKETPVRMALEYDRSVVPVHIDAHNSRLFNGIYRVRRAIGLDINLEMFLLARELLKPACKEFSVTVGEMLTPEQITSMGSDNRERAEGLKQICEKLPETSKKLHQEQLQS